jgi:hypothetical protein
MSQQGAILHLPTRTPRPSPEQIKGALSESRRFCGRTPITPLTTQRARVDPGPRDGWRYLQLLHVRVVAKVAGHLVKVLPSSHDLEHLAAVWWADDLPEGYLAGQLHHRPERRLCKATDIVSDPYRPGRPGATRGAVPSFQMTDLRELAARAFTAAQYDFSELLDLPDALFTRGDRHGVRLVVAPTRALPVAALDAILAWRLGQYLLTGFYDADLVGEYSLEREDPAGVHDGDVHGLAVDCDGDLLTYLTFKQPDGLAGHAYGDPERPQFPCEEVHGRAWQEGVTLAHGMRAELCWEAARFVTDQRRPSDPMIHRGALEIALAAVRLATRPDLATAVQLVTGDLDPQVALRNLRYFFIPVATFPPHQVDLPEGHLLRPRYRDHGTAPFLANAADMDWATYVRWADIDLALNSGLEETYLRFRLLRQFVSVKESSLKRPNQPDSDSPYPLEALTSASSLAASEALWLAATGGRISWEALTLGPGQPLPRDRVCWIVEGFAQALTFRAGGLAHLAGIGPEACFVPQESLAASLASLDAATPVRVLATSREEFEAFWRLRQRLFETSSDKLYGMGEVLRGAD